MCKLLYDNPNGKCVNVVTGYTYTDFYFITLNSHSSSFDSWSNKECKVKEYISNLNRNKYYIGERLQLMHNATVLRILSNKEEKVWRTMYLV